VNELCSLQILSASFVKANWRRPQRLPVINPMGQDRNLFTVLGGGMYPLEGSFS
jgi:hypothetical protein